MKKILIILGVVLLLVVAGRTFWAYQQVKNDNPQQQDKIVLSSEVTNEALMNTVLENYCQDKNILPPMTVSGSDFGANSQKNSEKIATEKDIEKLNLMGVLATAGVAYVPAKDLQIAIAAQKIVMEDIINRIILLKEEHNKFSSQLSSVSLQEIIQNLLSHEYDNSQIRVALRTISSKLMSENNFDDSFKIQECNAKKYYDPLSMYFLAKVYKHGTDEMKKQIPTLVVKTPIKPDLNESYFWISSAFTFNQINDVNLGLSYDAIAVLDDLQETKMNQINKTSVDTKLKAFVAYRYPQYESLMTAALKVTQIIQDASAPKDMRVAPRIPGLY